MKKLEGKWALVTGSSRGIGQQIAVGLAGHGCKIILHGTKVENTAGTLEMLRGSAVHLCVVAGDLSTREGREFLVRGVEAGPGKVDILYNNAGIMNSEQSIWDVDPQTWRDVLEVNLVAMVELCRAFVPGMVQRGYGRIINVSSGIKDTPNFAPYSVSKAAVDKYTQDLAAELRGTNVLANYLDPGWLKTDMGGPDADHEVETVLPGALVPALLEDNGPSGQLYKAQEYK